MSADFGVLVRCENGLRVIFDQWPKLSLGLDVRHENPILKGLYQPTNDGKIQIPN